MSWEIRPLTHTVCGDKRRVWTLLFGCGCPFKMGFLLPSVWQVWSGITCLLVMWQTFLKKVDLAVEKWWFTTAILVYQRVVFRPAGVFGLSECAVRRLLWTSILYIGIFSILNNCNVQTYESYLYRNYVHPTCHFLHIIAGVDPRISLHSVKKNGVGGCHSVVNSGKRNSSIRNEKPFCRGFSGHFFLCL